ncbi:MAG: DUF1292 domain-containing protein [Oscillospiraceae bacterium]|jgi:uncharacterized protein YrzB (UPF0473 family)|nr:DUF1292 domain-containing protein [Oscillospiraceae bacterium]
MNEDFGGDIITITDDDGSEYELEHLDTIEDDGDVYMAFASAESMESDDSDDVDVVIFRCVEEDGENVFEAIEDDGLLERIYGIFMQRMEDAQDAADEDDRERHLKNAW